MPSLSNESARNELIGRLQRLTPQSKAKWGSLDAPHMLCHLADVLAASVGDISTRSLNRKAFQRFPLKHLIIHVLPFPRGVAAPAEFLATAPQGFEHDRRRVIDLIDRLVGAPDSKGPEHPLFGPLTNEEWRALQWKHINHHLKQFGCQRRG